MSDVYIVYSREDVQQAEKLVNILSTRWDVWWDDKIVGDFSTVIEREIQTQNALFRFGLPRQRTTAMSRMNFVLQNNIRFRSFQRR
ncbi:hypothetical protein LAV78_13810 [Brucella intermedia]|uniref:hypothetical protein n=1 Tax=Brucella intermedia TaxID=94625 RepID=UPI001E4265CB|nr:hypothetical protein [Brucella intermedia]MCB4919601.1 hypothetical protein [Brucella intermedia]